MRVLRDNKDSVMAMLEAFVYDPLISWRLLTGKGEDEAVIIPPDGLPGVNSEDGRHGTDANTKSPIDLLGEQISRTMAVRTGAMNEDRVINIGNSVVNDHTQAIAQSMIDKTTRIRIPDDDEPDSDNLNARYSAGI